MDFILYILMMCNEEYYTLYNIQEEKYMQLDYIDEVLAETQDARSLVFIPAKPEMAGHCI